MSITIEEQLRLYWNDRIGEDLKPFADPGTDVRTERSAHRVSAEWLRRGVHYTAEFTISVQQGCRVLFNDHHMSYQSFLAGPAMADLLGLAKMVLQAKPSSVYVDTKAGLVDKPGDEPRSAVDLLTELLAQDDADATHVVMVTGEAGAGKTCVLQELVRAQADAYRRGAAQELFLYVNAQGRALARLNEALAAELQDLRSLLTYHAVPCLVRARLLVPVIDGFDELLGAGGYDDAFNSLARFIEELDGSGTLVASARSTYYEEEFVARAVTQSSLGRQAWRQTPVRVSAWTEVEFGDFIERRLDAGLPEEQRQEVIADVKQAFTGESSDLLSKPLFVSRAVDLRLSGTKLDSSSDLLADLVNAYIERERTEKLLARDETPLLGQSDIHNLFMNLAEEMWHQETRELDRESVRFVAEYVLSGSVAENELLIVIERMPTMAFLAVGERPGCVRFEHELFFSIFLGRVFAQRLGESASGLRGLLSRSIVPQELAEVAVQNIVASSVQAPAGCIRDALLRLSEAGGQYGQRSDQVKENGGRIITAMFGLIARREGAVRGLRIANTVFPGGDLGPVQLSECRFEKVVFKRTDLSRARLVKCQAYLVLLNEVIVDPEVTRLELAGLEPASQVTGLRQRVDGIINPVYDPGHVEALLQRCGAVPLDHEPIPGRRVAEGDLRLLERLARAYGRANPVCTSDGAMRETCNDRRWPRIQRLLEKHEIVNAETRDASGPSKVFLRRRVRPELLMMGLRKDADVPANIRMFWDELEAGGR
jgi:hypothetical protein